jgi:hypothetical protein
LDHVAVTDNTAYNGRGGGICVADLGAAINITNSIISHNLASTTSLNGTWGGGIDFSSGQDGVISHVNILNSLIEENTLDADDSPTIGGGINIRIQDAEVVIDGTTIRNNHAGVGEDIGEGGGLYIAAATTMIRDSVITGNSSATTGGGIDSEAIEGSSTMTVENTTISNNTAAVYGGGVFNIAYAPQPGQHADLVIRDSTISGNVSNIKGGGIANLGFNSGLASIGVINSTVSGNSANYGGAIYMAGGYSAMMLDFSTVAFSSAAAEGGGIYKDISGPTGPISISNSIVANNTAPSKPDIGGEITSADYNHIGNVTGGVFAPAPHDVVGSDPQIGPLANNGGPTLTHLPAITSPVVNSIPFGANGCGSTISTDQRGRVRPVGPGCDKGSVETDVIATPTATATPTGSPSCTGYSPSSQAGTITPGTDDAGNHTDDGVTPITMPFRVLLYGTSYSNALVDSNGVMAFSEANSTAYNSCLPRVVYTDAIFAHWDDLRTDAGAGCAIYPGGICGIFTTVTGAAPNRTLVVEWRTVYYAYEAATANFEILLHENSSDFEVVYGTLVDHGSSATAGVQRGTGTQFTQYACDGGLPNETQVNYTFGPCFTPTPTSTATPHNRARADFDGDGITDLSVYRPSEGNWYYDSILNGFNGVHFGEQADIPAPGDFDNDGKTDISVFRPSNGVWYRINSGDGTFAYAEFGLAGDKPQAGDFDADGRADQAVFRPSNGTWYWLRSIDEQQNGMQFGQNGDTPAVGDYDGDGKMELCVFRGGIWYWINTTRLTLHSEQFGFGNDKPVPADYDGDSKTDIAVFRPSTGEWYVHNSGLGIYSGLHWGQNGDVPVPGDYYGRRKDEFAIYRQGTWYVYAGSGGANVTQFGLSTDIPIPSKYIP